jgi:predicted CXXCH cytochrome family protein
MVNVFIRERVLAGVVALGAIACVAVALVAAPTSTAQKVPAGGSPPVLFAAMEASAAQGQAPIPGAHLVGSKTCASCHRDEYAHWSKTRMANVVTDPKLHPDVVAGDFATPNPLVTFKVKDVDFVYGTVWKQRYFHKAGKTYVPYPVQWDITNKKWLAYHVPDTADWWAAHYPDPKGDNSGRPTGPLCDGCHSVGYDIATEKPAEWNVGCETCHGGGSVHAARPTRDNILNPAKMDYVRASDTCIQCHSQGQPLKAAPAADGKYYDWPVGYSVGLKLSDYWALEPHKLGEQTFTHYADGTGHKNRMQGNDFTQSLMYARGVTCFSCHDPHGTENKAMLRAPPAEICATCHKPNGPFGPRAATIEAHTHHAADSAGSQCIACHMPKIEQTVANINVASHTFHFTTPTQTDLLKIPNACNGCHTDKSTSWAAEALKSWPDRSPWRMAQ